MPLNMQPGNMPHLFWIDLDNNGMFTECAVMKKDDFGNVYFFPLTSLDRIDKGRLARILSNRNATAFPLWDLMSQITLNNGVNALTYFHQLVEVISAAGVRTRPREGVVGTEGVIDTRGKEARAAMEANVQTAANAAANAAAQAAAAAIRGEQPVPAAAVEPAKPRTTRKKAAPKAE